ncbi:GDP-mannose 4,6-dehydratase [Desulfobacter postgatei]|jgi:GDPmannose 4,6-dehydratase|uniref:GDP-mannose 4,6-dehydratase n=1 Tax=Desulfobacter postgatei TaxID=2293 RepID=UPI002A36DFE2|nr:GDP-mannose 4,6-dehydratase [Desulfobacter postgatei]MDX9963587.1 GDP-mannose 4,6-dehydratase [Desulfobacter postgatei]
MKTAVIFGVSGQDGAFLSRLLLEKQYRVIGVCRNTGNAFLNNLDLLNIRHRIELIPSSIGHFDPVKQIVQEYKPDEIYNLAGQSSVSRSFEEPVATFEGISIGTLNLLETVRTLNLPVKLYNAGSGDCFGNIKGQAATEETRFNPASPYGVAKACAFWQVAAYRDAYGIFACTGLLFNHESHLRPAQFVTQKIVKTACRIAQGKCSELILGNIGIERDWGWAPEYVVAMWKMLQQETPDDYIIATGTTISLEDFIRAVFQRLNLDWKKYVTTDYRFLRPSDIATIRANPQKAQDRLGWKAKFTGYDVARMMVEAELNIEGNQLGL